MISVVIPLYNKEAIIKKSLESVLTQDYDDFEVVVVNDGSTDKSVEIVKSIHDPRITLIEQENGGPSKARNTGVKNAKGEWILFLDADDELLPGAFNVMSKLIKENPSVEHFACMSYVYRGNDIIEAPPPHEDMIMKDPYASHMYRFHTPRTGNSIYSRELLERCPFNEKIRRFEDVEWLFRIFDETKLFYCNSVVHRVNTDYAQASAPRKNIEEDFVGYISFDKCRNFYKKLWLFEIFIGERGYYQESSVKYDTLSYRYDLRLLYKLFKFISRCSIVRDWAIKHIIF